jgi:hypothetical protein
LTSAIQAYMLKALTEIAIRLGHPQKADQTASAQADAAKELTFPIVVLRVGSPSLRGFTYRVSTIPPDYLIRSPS